MSAPSSRCVLNAESQFVYTSALQMASIYSTGVTDVNQGIALSVEFFSCVQAVTKSGVSNAERLSVVLNAKSCSAPTDHAVMVYPTAKDVMGCTAVRVESVVWIVVFVLLWSEEFIGTPTSKFTTAALCRMPVIRSVQ